MGAFGATSSLLAAPEPLSHEDPSVLGLSPDLGAAMPPLKLDRQFNQLVEGRRQLRRKNSRKPPTPPLVVSPQKEDALDLSRLLQTKTTAPRPADSYPMFLVADQMRGQTDTLVEAEGSVVLRKTDLKLFAQHLRYWPLDDEIEAQGQVRLIQDDSVILTPHLRMKLAEQVGRAESATYALRQEVPIKAYAPTTLSPVVQTSSGQQSVAGAPMMLNIPNVYGLPEKTGSTRTVHAYGEASRIDFLGRNLLKLTDATYSTCKPGDRDWVLRSQETTLDQDESVGTAQGATLSFKDVPFAYVPSLSFSLAGQRRSGVLHPTFASSTRSGLDLTVPYYWNIAPNYDATFYPRLLSKRGMQLGVETRYRQHHAYGVSKLEYLPEDALTNARRYAYQFQHQQNLGRGISAGLNWNGVSDDTYWQDLTSRLALTTGVQLPRQLNFAYAPLPWLTTSTQFLRYQTLQPDPANPVAKPYILEPQINLFGYKANVAASDFAVVGQYSRFIHPEKTQGDRVVLYPQFSLPYVHPGFQFTPKIGMHMTRYVLDWRNGAQAGDSVTRTLPILSLDANVIFERDTRLLGKDFLQTLEPRLYYVRIPYRDQSQIPLFDSALSDFNFAQIFAENRYSGYDRINDANQLTAALTSRMIDPNTGVERFKGMIGQRYYFSEQKVTLSTAEHLRNQNFSNLILGATGLIANKTFADMALEYDHRNSQSQRFAGGVRFQPDHGRVISASYRYTRDPLSTQPLVDQVDLAGQWPIAPKWYGVGRYNYSLKDNRTLETIMGFEYNAGCWATRLVSQRLEAIAGAPNTTVFFQLELSDFGSVGSNPLQFLRRTIPGYGKMNEFSEPTGSLLTTE